MQTVNLKKYYYPLFTKDTFVEVSDEVSEALLLMHREENNRIRKMYYHKAYFSLDREDGIENDAVCGFEKSPEEILMEQEEERFFRLTLERLDEALSNLTETQQRRIRARYLSGRTMQDITAGEGVSVSVVSESIRSGLKKLQNPGGRDKSLVYKGALIHRSGVCALPGAVAYFVRDGELHSPNPLCAPRSTTPALRLSCSRSPEYIPAERRSYIRQFFIVPFQSSNGAKAGLP